MNTYHIVSLLQDLGQFTITASALVYNSETEFFDFFNQYSQLVYTISKNVVSSIGVTYAAVQ